MFPPNWLEIADSTIWRDQPHCARRKAAAE
jgi:hypothetical protein